MKTCAICGKEIDGGLVVEKECLDKLIVENAELKARLSKSIEVPMRGDKVWAIRRKSFFYGARTADEYIVDRVTMYRQGEVLVYVYDNDRTVPIEIGNAFWGEGAKERAEAEANLKELEGK